MWSSHGFVHCKFHPSIHLSPLIQGGAQGLTRCPSHLIWFLSALRSSGSTPSSSRMAELLTLSLMESPATLRRKLISLVPVIVFFRSLPKAHDHSSLFTTMDQCRVRITADATPIHLSISCSILPSLVNNTPRYLNSSTWIKDLLLDPEKALHLFLTENHGLGFGGTNHLVATAPVSHLNNGGTKHGPLGLNVPHLPRDMVKAIPEVVVESPTPLEKTGSRAHRVGELTGGGSHVASLGCAWPDSMGRDPATRRSPTCPAPKPGSRRGPR
ncbi:hypothetical protein D4764_05G0010770 [Takifugu flavidus]|uniref:Uncharacterized protein n=1 Tax=Takifugu flavidus TaxID=433684 RepID=A0A5C6N5Q1_9TELE|nr:hypothetical protein D4764_05G0010770 [Takifugu flavidus]